MPRTGIIAEATVAEIEWRADDDYFIFTGFGVPYAGAMREVKVMNHAGPGANMRFSDIVIDDANLSMAAKGVFVTIGLLGSGCTVDAVRQRSSNGRDVVLAAVEELRRAGYVSLDDDQVFIEGPATFGVRS